MRSYTLIRSGGTHPGSPPWIRNGTSTKVRRASSERAGLISTPLSRSVIPESNTIAGVEASGDGAATLPAVSDWNFADLWELVASLRPEAEAVVQGERRVGWAELSARADAIGARLLDAGLRRGARVAQYLVNSPAYLESVFAAFKVGMVPVNTNYRYTEDELAYLWDNADVEAVVVDARFLERTAAVLERRSAATVVLVVGGDEGSLPAWAESYETVATSAVEGPLRAPWGRSGDDPLMVYTGGTTGMPKGVIWRQDDLVAILNRTAVLRYPEEGGLAGAAELLAAPSRRVPPRHLPGPPLMHGTGLFSAFAALGSGGCVVLPVAGHFDPVEVLDTAEREHVTEMSIVGDAFARPLLAALDAHPGRWALDDLWLMVSSGVMWSAQVKAGLARHLPRLVMVDSLGSTEALGVATAKTEPGGSATTAGFVLGPDTRVLAEDGSDVVPGSGQRGLLAVRGRGPIGYHKDPDRTEATFRLIGTERWTVPGDWAEVGADGAIRLLGRGSVVVNTGGEKVFPEEVEEVLKQHPAVEDALVVGVPDERFGEAVVGVVQPASGAGAPEVVPGELIGFVKSRLAGYKAPRHVVVVPSIRRAPNGKADYAWARAEAAAAVG
jgi:acyl-CoA synthetase (AMP-forming)/AMP-acid ligase II